VRRERPAPPPNGEIPDWVRRFRPADWPITVERIPDVYGSRPEEWIRVRQRHEWHRARCDWCQKHGVDVHALIRERRAESVYRIEMRWPTWSWPTGSAKPSR
jgi:hypothetical protein